MAARVVRIKALAAVGLLVAVGGGGRARAAVIDPLTGYSLNVTSAVGTSSVLPNGWSFTALAGSATTLTGIASVTNAQLVTLATTPTAQQTFDAMNEGSIINAADHPINITYTANGGGHLMSAATTGDGANGYLLTLTSSGALAANATVSAQWRMSQVGPPSGTNVRPEEMAGWYVFYQVNGTGGTWNRLAGVETTHPATATPPTVGTEPLASTPLPVSLAAGNTINFLFLHDNGLANSPDDNWGLASFAVTPVGTPEPGTLGMGAVAVTGALVRRRRARQAS
jgi:MYXO-CTERM domain-containing protein